MYCLPSSSCNVPAEPPLHVSPAAPLIADEREGDDDDEVHGDANGS